MSHRKRLAIVTTVWEWRSHANHMGERFLCGYPRDGRWHHPEMDIVAAYVDQCPEADLSRRRAREHGFTIYPTIAAALRQGTDALAVDAVLLIAEHGEYATNDKGQKLYPRHEFFTAITDVFRQDGRSVPVFNDKHLSYSFDKAQHMVALAQELGFPLLAGSSLPVTFRLPPVELPLDCVIDAALMIGVGGSDAMDFHALEAMLRLPDGPGRGDVRHGPGAVPGAAYAAGQWHAGTLPRVTPARPQAHRYTRTERLLPGAVGVPVCRCHRLKAADGTCRSVATDWRHTAASLFRLSRESRAPFLRDGRSRPALRAHRWGGS